MLSSKKHKSYIFSGGIFISLIFFVLLLTFNFAFLTHSALAQGLTSPDVAGTGLSDRSLPDTILNIINIALGFVSIIALAVIIYGGYVWMTSGGIPQRIALAKKILISAVIGLIIILTSWAIVNFIINGMNGGGGGGPGPGPGPGPLPGGSISFRVDEYDPIGPGIAICSAIQATFNREYQSGSITSGAAGTFHLMKYCTGNNQCNTIGLGDCVRNITGLTGTFCDEDIAGAFDYDDLNTVGFKSTNELEKNMDYKVLIDGGAGGVQSDSGADCNGANDICKDWDFTTGDFSDNIPPQVLKVSPQDGALNVCRLKSIAAQFSEKMYKPSLTKPTSFSTTPAHIFSPSAPTFEILRESPKTPYTSNTAYTPLLNADVIMDTCWNKLDGNKNGVAEGAAKDNYPTTDPGVPIGTTSTWQFTTGETTQCVPKIDSIVPADSYYDAPGDTLTITGENFDDIPDTVLFSDNLPIGSGTPACFNGTHTQTDQACLLTWDGVSPLNSITVKVPAGKGSSNGAVSGPIKVQVGQFQCGGQTTCKDGVNKGLACTADLDCPGSLCGDDGSCEGGANSGLGCDAITDCPGAESAGVTIKVLSPYIKKLAPTTLGAGSPVGIFGKQFGNAIGTVDLIDGVNRIPLVLPCGDNSWTDSYIVAEAPLNTPVGNYTIQVIDSSGRHSNLGSLTVTNDPPGPLLCPIADFCSSGGPVNFTATGKRLGDDKGADDDVEFVDSSDNINNATIANPVNDWSDIQITGDTPTLTDNDYSVRAALDKGAADERRSNSIPFDVPCKGRPNVLLSNACPGSSPNPRPNSTENCINLQYVSARFNQDMTDIDLTNPANVSVYQCNIGSIFDSASCGAAIAGTLTVQNISPSSDETRFSPTAPLTQNTWYEFRISGNVRSSGGLTMNENKAYPFHIRDSTAECQTNAIDVLPNSASVAILGTKDFSANELDANTCNVLKPSTAAWQSWVSGNLAAATVIGVPANTDTATGVANGTANISAFLDSNGTILTDSSILKVGTGVAGGISCNNNNVREDPEECDGTDIGTCAPATQSCALKISPCTCQPIPTITAIDWCKDGGGLAGKNTAITVKFSALMDPSSFKINTGNDGTVSLMQDINYIDGSLKIANIGTNTEAIFYPNSQLGDNLDYIFTIKEGGTGVLSKYGIPLAVDSVSNFTTGTNLCKIDKVTIILEKDFNPDPTIQNNQSYIGPDLFTCAGKDSCPDDYAQATNENQHNAIAEAKDAAGLTLSGVAYSWTKSTDAPFTMLTPDANATLVQADPKSGIGALTVKADGGLAGTKTASTNVTVAPCDNPWPGNDYPFRDNGANPTNFSLWYCRDAGAAGPADDLPALSIISKNGTGELVKELFFYDAANPNDALGLRVYSNNTSHWSAKNWYEKRAPNRQGAPSSTTVDGWGAVQAGRTIYVNAANHTSAAPPAMNIYLMSHSDKISNNLKNILNQLKSNWKFAITEYDDGTDGTALNPAAPQNHLRKLQRDTKRLTDLYDAAVDLYEYKMGKGKYPLLPAGTYLNGHSVSTWPSWDGTLSQEVRAPMPHDPISQMSSLIGWWKLDEGSGDVTADDGPYGIDGAPKNFNDPYGWRIGSQCKFGNCMELDGWDDFIDTGNFAGLYSNKLTVAAWIKTKLNADWDAIVAGECGNFVFALYSGSLFMGDQCGDTDNIGTDMKPLESNKKIDDDKWHFVAAVYDGLVMKLYIDGVFEAAGPANGDFDTTGGNLYIGSTPNNSEYFDGSIDEVRIWNTPLSDGEINNLFKSNAAKFGSSEDSGWDQTKNAFSCIAGADYDTHIYHYKNESNGDKFGIYAALEYAGNDGSTWRQLGAPFNPCDGVGDSQCACYNYRQQEVIPTDLGLCGNGQWDSSFGEACETSIPDPNLNGLGSRICSTGKCSNDNTKTCTDNLQCPGGVCTPDTPTCDAACQPYCEGAPVVKAVCKNGKIESPIENCECSDFNNPATCNTVKGLMNEYYCYDDGVAGNDLDDAAITAEKIDDTFLKTVSCSPVNCNLSCAGGTPIHAEINNGFWEPWIGEQCDAKRGYCSNNSNPCSQDSDCGGNCIAIGNGGYYCDLGGNIQCNNGVRSCDSGTLTSCIGGNAEWLSCGGDAFSPATGPYNYLNNPDGTNLYGWCFR